MRAGNRTGTTLTRSPVGHGSSGCNLRAALGQAVEEARRSASRPSCPHPELALRPGSLGPADTFPPGHFKVGRILTSVVAMACLRAQQAWRPQLTSHVFGLKKALLDGGGADGEAPLKGQEWLTSDEGVQWILESTDDISGWSARAGQRSPVRPRASSDPRPPRQESQIDSLLLCHASCCL